MRFLYVLALFLCVACSPPTPPPIAVELEPTRPASYPDLLIVPPAVVVMPERASLELPNTCDPLLVIETPSGPVVSKLAPSWLASEHKRGSMQAWIRGVVEIVGVELGADAVAREMIYRKAILESSGNPGAVHRRSPDIEANRRAARRARAAADDRWADARVPIYRRSRGELIEVGDHDAWAVGRGLYGMISSYAPRWSPDAPPWSLCDPIVSTVVVYWAMRGALDECRGTTLRDAYRRFSSGRCALRSEEHERRFDRLARGNVRGLKLGRFNPDARADFGEAWPEETTDRGLLLAKLRARVDAELGPMPN